jgi:prephenate dehydrogenase
MSSYLNIYVRPNIKDGKESKKMCLMSVSRSHPLYQAINEAGSFYAYTSIGENTEERFYELTSNLINSICKDSSEEIMAAEKRLKEYEKYASGNSEIIQDIISTKEYLEEIKETYNQLCFIRQIVDDVENGFTDFGKVFINIS